MNGYSLMAESYKKAVEQGKMDKKEADKLIRIYDFLATCDDEDKSRLVDSSAFNEFILGAVIITLENLNWEKKDIKDVVYECQRGTFDQYTANQMQEAYKKL